MQLLMNGPLCQKINLDLAKKHGDILLVFNQKNNTSTPVHASVYLDATSVFEKASNSTSSSPKKTS